MTDYCTHLEELAVKHGVLLAPVPTIDDGHAHPKSMAVCVMPPRCEVSYAIALHEMGHCVAPDGNLPQTTFENTRRSEEAAWAWAESVARDWSPTMEHIKTVCLSTYTLEIWNKREAMRLFMESAMKIRTIEAFEREAAKLEQLLKEAA